jgi:chromate transporter
MFTLSWVYVRYGLCRWSDCSIRSSAGGRSGTYRARRNTHRRTCGDRHWLWAIAILATAAQLAGIHFGIIPTAGGLIYLFARRRSQGLAWLLTGLATAGLGAYVISMGTWSGIDALSGGMDSGAVLRPDGMSLLALFWSGLKAGLLTFGGAYTVIPFLQHVAVTRGAWMSDAQFLDGLALSGLLPAPLIIFSTFVGYIGGGPLGAIAITIGIFLPAFAITLTGHDVLEWLVHLPRFRLFLEGLTAGVVGLIAGTTWRCFEQQSREWKRRLFLPCAWLPCLRSRHVWQYPQ